MPTPASHGHSNGGWITVQTLRPSAKNVTSRTSAGDEGLAWMTTVPVTNAPSAGEMNESGGVDGCPDALHSPIPTTAATHALCRSPRATGVCRLHPEPPE